ncbi:MAG: YbhN family protein [Acidimicrobiales bacterium]
MEGEPEDTVTRSRRRWWHRGPFVRREVRLSVGTLLVFLFVFYVALPLLASHRAEVNSLAHINIGYLVLGVLLEIGALVAYTQLTHAVLPSDGPRRLRLFRINMSTLALSHVSPGGTAPGAALGYRLLTQSGVSGADAGFALGTQGIGSAVVLNVMFWCSLVAFLVTHGFHVPASHSGGQSQSASILVIVAAGVGVILLGAFGGLFYLLTRGQHQASRVIRRVAGRIRFLDADRTTALVEQLAERFAGLMENRSLTRRAVGWAAANWLLDAASLWVFVAAFSHFISPVDLLMAYGLANILAAIPITPGGLGVVEFVLVSMITGFGPTAGQALSAVLAYRAVNFWLPIPFGGLAYASLEFERRTPFRRLHRFVRHRIHLLRKHTPTPTVDPEPGGRAGVQTPGLSAASATADPLTAPPPPTVHPGPTPPAVPPAPRERSLAPGGEPRVPVGSRRGETAGIRAPVFETDPAR